MRKHYAVFLSPGTFFMEQSSRPIPLWDVGLAARMAEDITERYHARPYGFYFITQLEVGPVADGEGGWVDTKPKEVERSGTYYLGGKLLRYDEVIELEKEQPHKFGILRSNMRCNEWPLVIENTNSYRVTLSFHAKDCIVTHQGTIAIRGDDGDLQAYREQTIAKMQQETAEELRRWKEEKAACSARR